MSNITIPKTCRAAVCVNPGPEYTVKCVDDHPVPSPKRGEVLLKFNSTGLCLSDHHFMKGDWGVPMDFPKVDCAGHEGAGIIVALGEDVDQTKWKVGQRAGLKPITYVCGACEYCRGGNEAICEKTLYAGAQTQGSYCEYVTHPASYLSSIPDGVADEIAGPIMCSGATCYGALRRSGARPGQWVAIPGAGGGVGSMAVQYARCLGLRVIAIDTGDDKRKQTQSLGAEAFVDFLKSNVAEEVHRITGGGAHAVVVTGGTGKAYEGAHRLLRRAGVMVCVGLPPAGTAFAGGDPLELIFQKLEVRGSLVGSLDEVAEALDFAARGLVDVKNIHVHEFEEFPALIKDLAESKIVGRAVVKFH